MFSIFHDSFFLLCFVPLFRLVNFSLIFHIFTFLYYTRAVFQFSFEIVCARVLPDPSNGSLHQFYYKIQASQPPTATNEEILARSKKLGRNLFALFFSIFSFLFFLLLKFLFSFPNSNPKAEQSLAKWTFFPAPTTPNFIKKSGKKFGGMIIFCDFFVFFEKLFLQQVFVYLEILVDGVGGQSFLLDCGFSFVYFYLQKLKNSI